jgi:hypothetical protein
VGHEERFPPTKLSAGCGFRKETIAGMPQRARCEAIYGKPPTAALSRPILQPRAYRNCLLTKSHS